MPSSKDLLNSSSGPVLGFISVICCGAIAIPALFLIWGFDNMKPSKTTRLLQIVTILAALICFVSYGYLIYLRTANDSASFVYILMFIFYSIVGALAAILAYSFLKAKWSTNLNDATSGLHGTAGWEMPQEWLVPRTSPIQPGALALAPYNEQVRVEIPRAEIVQHGLAIGPPGSGKSRGLFLPSAAWLAASQTSIICTDPKSELWHNTSGHHENPIRFAPLDPNASACWNPIPDCKDSRVSSLLARALIESGQTQYTDQFWIDNETNLCSALFAHVAFDPNPTLATVYEFLTTCSGFSDLIDKLRVSPSNHAKACAGILEMSDRRIQGSILPGVASRLEWLTDDSVCRFTSASLQSTDFEMLRQTPCALYWCLPERDIARLRPLTSMFFTKVFDDLGTESNPYTAGASASIPITLLFDEFANIGKIPNFDSVLTLARSKNLALILGVQSIAQLDLRYGKEAARVTLDACSTKIILPGLDFSSAEYISKALGEETVVVGRTSQSQRGMFEPVTTTYSESEHPRRILTADEIRRIGRDEMIVISGNRRPTRMQRYFYNQPPNEAQVSGLGPALISHFESSRKERVKAELPPPLE